MNSIQKEQNNLGGIAKIWVIPAALIYSLERSETPGAYVAPAGCLENAFEFWPVFQSASFDEEQGQQSAGHFFNQTVLFTIPKHSIYNSVALESLTGRLWAILILDQNSQYKLIGCRDYPLRMVANIKTGADISDLNHIAMKFSGQSPFRAVFVDKPA